MEAPEAVPQGVARAPTPKSPPPETSRRPVSRHHGCQLYESDDFLCEAAARYVLEGLQAGQPVLLAVTEAHHDGIERGLAALGTSLADVERAGRLTVWDAEALLDRFMAEDAPDPERFRRVMDEAFDRLRPGQGPGPVRVFGEMVDVLWRAGNWGAAFRLERLWNELAQRRPLELLCSYSMGNFHLAAHSAHFDAVCAEHGRVLPAESLPADQDAAARELGISVLQQRAHALESELLHRAELERALRQALEDRTRAEQALLAARGQAEQAARAKSEVLALMSHELRTPLNAILGYQDLLEHGVGGALSAEQRAYLSRMRTCAHELLRLIDQVLSLSRIEANGLDLRKDVFSALTLARETATIVEPGAQRRGLALEVAGPHTEITLVTDAGTVRQILLNLLTNAIKFTDAGGIRLRVSRQGDDALFEVMDTGIGIRPEDLERIFEPFVQVESVPGRRVSGSGLGLAVSRDLARLLGGEVTVGSELGSGSTFTLTVPIARLARA